MKRTTTPHEPTPAPSTSELSWVQFDDRVGANEKSPFTIGAEFFQRFGTDKTVQGSLRDALMKAGDILRN